MRNEKGQFVKGSIPWSLNQKFSEKHRKNLSITHLNNKTGFQKGHKINVGNKFNLGRKKSKEWIAKISQANKNNKYALGSKWDEERRKNFAKFKEKNHWRWIVDRTQIKHQENRNNPAYKQWRMKIWLRDEFICKIKNANCKGKIEAHHILNWKDYPELRYDINNGITLCHAHHPRRRAEVKRLEPIFQVLVSETKD